MENRLQCCAAADDGQRVKVIRTQILDQLEGQGWDVRGPVHRVWAGERDAASLVQGKDEGSQAAVSSILRHVRQLDADFGFKTWLETA